MVKEEKSLVLQVFERRPRDEIKTQELVSYTGYSRETVNQHLKKLMNDGRIQKLRAGFYQYLMTTASKVIRQMQKKGGSGVPTKLPRQLSVPPMIEGIEEAGARLNDLTMEINELDLQLAEMVKIRNSLVKDFQQEVVNLSKKMYGSSRHIEDLRVYDPDRKKKVLTHFSDGKAHRLRDIIRKFDRDDNVRIQQCIARLYTEGVLERVERGHYRLKDTRGE